MGSPHEDLLDLYKSAVYLNNAGVQFLSHDEPGQALKSLAEGLTIIRKIVRQETEDSSAGTATAAAMATKGVARSAVQYAQQGLANLTQSTSKKCSTSASLSVVCYRGALSARFANEIVQDGSRSTTRGVAILMNDVSIENIHDWIHSIAPSIMLSNVALVHCSCYQLHNPYLANFRDCTLDGALRLMDMCQTVLGMKQQTMEVTEGNMFLAIAILNNVCWILLQQQQDESQLSMMDGYLLLHNTVQKELALLKTLSSRLTSLTSTFTRMAAAA